MQKHPLGLEQNYSYYLSNVFYIIQSVFISLQGNIRWNPQLDPSLIHMGPSTSVPSWDLLQSQYISVFSDQDDPKAKMSPLSPQFLEPLADFTFSSADIQAAIEEFDKTYHVVRRTYLLRSLGSVDQTSPSPSISSGSSPSRKESSCLPLQASDHISYTQERHPSWPCAVCNIAHLPHVLPQQDFRANHEGQAGVTPGKQLYSVQQSA